MIAEDQVRALVEQKISGSDQFVVDIKVHGNNKIVVLVDAQSGIGIDDCIQISKFVEESLDREEEDFELEVSSAGLDAPFIVEEQYLKALGKQVKVITEEGKKIEGCLAEVNEDGVLITFEEKQRIEGRRKKIIVPVEKKLYFSGGSKESNIKSTKIVISFK